MSNSGTDTVTFNVGGRLFEVSLSTLDRYPRSLLSQLVREQWPRGARGNAAVYLDRDGERFRYILDLMRDQKVKLPCTESREMFIREVKHLGLESYFGVPTAGKRKAKGDDAGSNKKPVPNDGDFLVLDLLRSERENEVKRASSVQFLGMARDGKMVTIAGIVPFVLSEVGRLRSEVAEQFAAKGQEQNREEDTREGNKGSD
jgi:hypothetical protein